MNAMDKIIDWYKSLPTWGRILAAIPFAIVFVGAIIFGVWFGRRGSDLPSVSGNSQGASGHEATDRVNSERLAANSGKADGQLSGIADDNRRASDENSRIADDNRRLSDLAGKLDDLSH